ncbi:MAG: hypothetical protein ACE363_07400 [Alphaproteobacteria bacterium]
MPALKKHLILVLTEPNEGHEAEFNDYYENTHLDEVLSSAGYDTAQRFKLVDGVGQPCPLPYLAVYEAQAEDSETALKMLNDSRSKRQQSKSLNKKTGRIWVFEELGPKHQR